jgi:hypothetical protein
MAIYDPQGDWILHEQGVELILALYSVGESYADIIVKRYRESDEVRYCEDVGQANRVLRECLAAGLPKIPGGLDGFPFSRTYFLDYLERNPPGRKRPRGRVKKPHRFASAEAPQVVKEYRASTPTPSKRGLDCYVRSRALKIPRETLRKEFDIQCGSLPPGRPRKK